MVTSLIAYTALSGAVALERLVELRISARNAAAALARGGVEVGRGHYRVMTVMHTLFLISCVLEPWLLNRSFPGAIGWLALALSLASQALRYWAITTLGSRWNTRVIVLPGVEPVTTGPYRFLRHPNYVAVIVELMALPMVHGAWVTALVFTAANALLLVVRVRAEEMALGPEYARAFADRARFVPGAPRG